MTSQEFRITRIFINWALTGRQHFIHSYRFAFCILLDANDDVITFYVIFMTLNINAEETNAATVWFFQRSRYRSRSWDSNIVVLCLLNIPTPRCCGQWVTDFCLLCWRERLVLARQRMWLSLLILSVEGFLNQQLCQRKMRLTIMLGLAKIAIDSLRNITKIMRQSQERLSSARMKDVVISPIQDIRV